jgi:hypothetical protein
MPPDNCYCSYMWHHGNIRATLTPYGKTVNIQTEKWSNNYRYSVENGVRQATILMTKHVPSHLTVAGYRVLLSYEGQPATCYGCGAIGHLYHECPIGQKSNQDRLTPAQQTYATIVSTPTARTAHRPATAIVNDGKQETPEHTNEPPPYASERTTWWGDDRYWQQRQWTANHSNPTANGERETQMSLTVLAGDTDHMDTMNY